MTATKKAIISPLFFALLLFNLFLPVLAAVIFSDGFESGDFSEWTGTGGTPSVVDTVAHHGTYSMKRSSTDDRCYKSFSEQDTVYARCYWQTDTLPSSGQSTMILRLFDLGYKNFYLYYRNNGGTLQWYLYEQDGGKGTYNQTITVDTWYCLEIFYDDPNDVIKLWVDGVERVSATESMGLAIDYVGLGVAGGLGYTHNDYFDCVVVADAYIGPEEEGQNITEVFEESAGVDYSIIDQKEKLIGCDESMTFHIELTTQKEQGISMIETIYQSPTITAVLYTSLDGEYGEIEMIYAIAALALIVALIGVALIIVHR